MHNETAQPISFEIPIYREVSGHFRTFMEEYDPTITSIAKFVAQTRYLTFTTQNSQRASVTIVPKSFDDVRKQDLAHKASAFASKFNATTALAEKEDVSMKIAIIDAKKNHRKSRKSKIKYHKSYGEDVICILKVTVIPRSEATREVLVKFFALLDFRV